MKYYGFTYSTEHHNFGEVLEVFEVPANWQGYRHQGYGAAPLFLEQALDAGEITWEEFCRQL